MLMHDFSKYLIRDTATVRDALIALNNLSTDSLTLFVLNAEGRMAGTVTDGDIRRNLIEGVTLRQPVARVMNTRFRFLQSDRPDVNALKAFRELNITLLPLLDREHRIVDVLNLKFKRSALPVDAVLMAGGRGERLRPLTETVPKPLLPVGDKPIIDYNVERLAAYGIRHISVTVNYLKEQLEAHFATPCAGVAVKCVREPRFLGTIGSVKLVDAFYNDTVLIMNSDLFTNIDYEDFYLRFLEYNADLLVAAVPYSVSVPYGIFEGEGMQVRGITEKPTYEYYANAGIYLVKRALLDSIPEGVYFDATDLIRLLVDQGRNVIRYPLTGYWIDIGKPSDYEKARELIKHIPRP